MKDHLHLRLDQVPLGAHMAIFGKGSATKFWGRVESHAKKIPTHSIEYLGKFMGKDYQILEAVATVQFNSMDKYLKKKNIEIVAQWYTNISAEQGKKLWDRAVWFYNRKRTLIYDIFGYLNFFVRLIPGVRNVFKPSNWLFFCSELYCTNWEGDMKSKWKAITIWDLVMPVTAKPNCTACAPIDIYLYLLKSRMVKTVVIKRKGEVLGEH
jgi:hypothetical protein